MIDRFPSWYPRVMNVGHAQPLLSPQAPQFYDSNVPPAPAGIVWWKYKSSVPPLPDPIDFFNGSSQFSRYGWKYDANYVANDYIFSKAPLCTDNLCQVYASDNTPLVEISLS